MACIAQVCHNFTKASPASSMNPMSSSDELSPVSIRLRTLYVQVQIAEQANLLRALFLYVSAADILSWPVFEHKRLIFQP